ncbi:ribosome biogenesis GTP-binding protein YihA/YsxC [Pelomicrobium sp.]|jgi:GTP-binding protein|uniref:ribosome biogenesis GTP-binding protein YihA/YsxC n=1 Tax=Pelomicrobium sp. TaxID=2815319 RepID=UPI002FDD6B99
MNPFHPLSFARSVTRLADLPPALREVAIGGRSNAGKSSLLNALAQRRRLAYVSKTPGRTREINFYRCGEGRFIVDLPGYGYARVPQAMRQTWGELVSAYLRTRASLAGVVLLMDARHPLMPLDWQLLHWLQESGKPVHAVLTKADKLSRQQALRTLAATRQALDREAPGVSLQLFSSLTRQGADELVERLAYWLEIKNAPG